MSAGDFQGTYSAEQVIVTVGGVIVTGFGDGDFITAKHDEDRYTHKVGADGEVGRAKNANRAGTIEIVLASTSRANRELGDLFKLSLMGGTDEPVSVSVADLSGNSECYASTAWLKTSPDFSRGKEISEQTWTLQAADLAFAY